MTTFIASLFLPYTVDFGVTYDAKDKVNQPPVNYAVDGSGYTAGQDQAFQYETMESVQPPAQLPLIPGATTTNEQVFAGYLPRATAEVENGVRPNEPRDTTWGRSQMFNQPTSQATAVPTPSLLSIPGSQKTTKVSPSLDGSQDFMDLGESSHPRPSITPNRWSIRSAEKGLGGLSNAIEAAQEHGLFGAKMWVGTLGMPTDSLTEKTKRDIERVMRKRQECLTVFAKDTVFEGHYTHFCHTVLWPVLHYQMQENPRHSDYDRYAWDKYVKLNERFADMIWQDWKKGDVIWVHDYHLLILPGILRKRLPRAEIGFFLHTPFPSSEVFRCLSARNELLDGMLGADLIGFQTEEYRNHFLQSCSRLRRLDISASEVNFQGRAVGVVKIPMGIDASFLKMSCNSTEVQGWIHTIQCRYPYQRLVVARDRLDVFGGIKQRLLAFELMLKSYPELRNDVILIQVISSAGVDPELEAQVSKITMRINTKYSSSTHQPVVLLQQDLSTHQFIALLNIADVFMATGLREGINLTSHEYVLCQAGEFSHHRHGSLIISEFVGSASIFHDCNGPGSEASELLVNPWDYKQCAAAIRTALSRSAEDRMTEWMRLHRRITPYSAINWYYNLTLSLGQICITQDIRKPNTSVTLPQNKFWRAFSTTKSRLFFLEDLVISGPDPIDESSPLYERIFQILDLFLRHVNNKLYITSSKTLEQFNESFPELPSTVGFILENGALIRHPGAQTWLKLANSDSWHAGIQKMMECLQERIEGSRIEASAWSLVFHFDGALDREAAAFQASELADQINGARGESDFYTIRKETSISVELPLSSQCRGKAASYILNEIKRTWYPEFVLVVGDSEDNQALFRWADELSGTSALRSTFGQRQRRISVFPLTTGEEPTEAQYTLPIEWPFWKLMHWLMNEHEYERSGDEWTLKT